MDGFQLLTNATQQLNVTELIPNIHSPEEMSLTIIFMLVAGFIALTLSFVITKRDKLWISLDSLTKGGLALLVGAVAYFVAIFSTLLYVITRSILYNEKDYLVKLNIFGFLIMIVYSFIIISFLHHNRTRKNGIDEFNILKFMEVSGYLIFFLFSLSIVFIFCYLVFLTWYKITISYSILFSILTIILTIVTYYSLSKFIKELTFKSKIKTKSRKLGKRKLV